MCNNPQYQWIKGSYDLPVPCPCGYCSGCRIDAVSLWTQRANYEFCAHEKNAFVTFTYDDYHLPSNKFDSRPLFSPSLDRKGFLNFLRRVREDINSLPVFPASCDRAYKTFTAGEYGDSFGRPHYHVLFFGLDYVRFKAYFRERWKNGQVECDPVYPGGIRYCMKYLEQKDVPSSLEQQYDFNGLERPFIQASLGFGSDFFFVHRDEIRKTGKVKIGGRYVPIPAYYRNLYFGQENIDSVIKEREFKIKKLELEMKEYGYDNLDHYLSVMRTYREYSALSRDIKLGKPINYKHYLRFIPKGDIRRKTFFGGL